MKLLPRYYQNLNRYLKPNKVLILYGPRQVGKTTLLKQFLQKTSLKWRFDSGDNLRLQQLLSSQDFHLFADYVADYQLIAIDEAQHIPRIGQALKILVDQFPGLRLIATGSSSFELAGQIGEPLTGRKRTLILYPLSLLELKKTLSPWELKQNLADYLVFGGYPEVLTAKTKKEKRLLLQELVDSYLLKDILAFEKVKSSHTLLNLLRLLAFQIGQQVSLSELGRQLGIDYKTVARYLDLLEKSFILFPLRGFSRNLRKEIAKKAKYYFYDTGVRNALIQNFNPPPLRNDLGQLWENYIVVERLKKSRYRQLAVNFYFWRTWEGQEIDLVEERGGRLFGYEIKWQAPKKPRPPKNWQATYPNARWQLITPENFLSFVA